MNKVIPREPRHRRGLRRDYTPTPQITKAYLIGLLHDATERKTTFRVATKSFEFAKIIQEGIFKLNSKAWIYREGKQRNLWIIEFSKSLLNNVQIKTRQNKIDYIRGYFDAEGGIAKSKSVRFYLYFCQKDKSDILRVKNYLEEFKISCGKIHNPSKKIDPNYWRFFISSKSYKDFAVKIGSNFPDKQKLLWMKI
ncbi:MAG: LAGLIDADG family homing endonuclease [Patescibacteria group bacterium]